MAFVTEEARTTSFPLLASPEDVNERWVEYIRGEVFCSLRL